MVPSLSFPPLLISSFFSSIYRLVSLFSSLFFHFFFSIFGDLLQPFNLSSERSLSKVLLEFGLLCQEGMDCTFASRFIECSKAKGNVIKTVEGQKS
ncbi:hypothetical protein PanWU01x14_319470 [Parasponia andersonii]|uniref:Uncharacterized protein n=1 Tax=Parasponia andersonii TaxID=3476 RepID=A0A2P5ALZ9_PARAD|nr:hypothetical protein PanWU01x14_319470 [Parasponia andersonii]